MRASMPLSERRTSKIGLVMCCLLAASFFLPVLARAQSSESNLVVSVRDLSIPPKAVRSFKKGIDLLTQKDPANSLPFFERAISQFAGYYEAYYEMGEADLQLWHITDAEKAFRKSVELSAGRYAAALLALGAALDYNEKYAEAEEVTRRGLELDPTSWSGRYYLGVALFSMNRLEEAEKSTEELLRRKADSLEGLRLLADIHAREKDYNSLVKDIDRYLTLDPDSPAAMKARAIRESTLHLLVEPRNTSALIAPHP